MLQTIHPAVSRLLAALGTAWRRAFPPPDDPSGPPLIDKAAVLGEAAKLSESVDAVSDMDEETFKRAIGKIAKPESKGTRK